MDRRTLLTSVAVGSLSWTWPLAQAQVLDLSDAINKAGRQRMLSQRMGKAWLALLQGIEPISARQVLDKSLSLFDRQLVELKGYAPTPDLLATYKALEAVWSDYKTALVGKVPSKEQAAALLQLDGKVLALAQQGTVQFETALAKPVGKLVNLAGRQRMLTQRMAKFYLAAALPVDASVANAEIAKARTEFTTAMGQLRDAPQATLRIKDELMLGDAQWVFFELALQKLQEGTPRPKALADVFVASENLLSVMDRVTTLYAELKA
jgi:hypothetical protein